jgi:hypothetical protein
MRPPSCHLPVRRAAFQTPVLIDVWVKPRVPEGFWKVAFLKLEPTMRWGGANHFARWAGWPVPCVRPAGYQEASPSPVYGAALLMRFGLLVHPGFKSPSLRVTCTLSSESLTGEGVSILWPHSWSHSVAQRAEPIRALASRTCGEATFMYRSVVVARARPRISWTTRMWTPCSMRSVAAICLRRGVGRLVRRPS